jgi:hypothetical protein
MQVNRNDRLVAIPLSAKNHEPMIPTKTFDKAWISDITKFFTSYNEARQEIQIPGLWQSPARLGLGRRGAQTSAPEGK